MEFACSQAPSRMQGAVMGFYYFCTGIGSFLGLALLEIFQRYIMDIVIREHSSDINKGKLFWFFFFLASIQLISVIIFIYLSKSLKIRRLPSSSRTANDISNTRSWKLIYCLYGLVNLIQDSKRTTFIWEACCCRMNL